MKVYIYRPAGNDTALIESNFKEANLLSQKIFKLRSNVEQVGFISKEQGVNRLDMAGGELCFNALRSAAKYFLSEQSNCEILHCGKIYKCFKQDDLIYTQIQLGDFALSQIDLKPLKQLCACEIKDAALVNLKDIVHLCVLINLSDFKQIVKDEDGLKNLSMAVFKQFGLLNNAACGLMFLAKDENEYCLAPVVWVKEINSLFYESACGSGSFASYLFLRPKLKVNFLALRQPSKEALFLKEEAQHLNISSFVQLLEVLEI